MSIPANDLAEAFRISSRSREGRGLRAGDPLCPGGQTATPVIGPPTPSARAPFMPWRATGRFIRSMWPMAKTLRRPSNSASETAKSYALNLWNGILFTTTSQGCNGNPNQMWAVKIDDPLHKVMTASVRRAAACGDAPAPPSIRTASRGRPPATAAMKRNRDLRQRADRRKGRRRSN